MEGELPPPLRLVDEEDLVAPGRPIWLRGLAALVIAMFALVLVLTAAATSGAVSLVTGKAMGDQVPKR